MMNCKADGSKPLKIAPLELEISDILKLYSSGKLL